MAQALGDLDLESELAQLHDNLEALRPGLGRGPPVDMRGDEPLGYGQAVGAVADLADLEALDQQLVTGLSRLDPGRHRRRGVGAAARAVGGRGPSGAARAGARARAAGLCAPRPRRHDDDAEGAAPARARPRCDGSSPISTPRARRPRRPAHRRGRRADRREPALAVRRRAADRRRAYRAQRRAAAPRVRRARLAARAGRPLVRLDVEDFAVAETERRTAAAVALCVDLSFSMFQEGRWGPMKQTALALSHLVATRFRQDALQIIGFDRLARRLTPVAAGRGRAGVGAGHQPAARADARRPAPASPPRCRAGGPGGDGRGADGAPRPETASAVLPLADRRARPCGRPSARSTR